MGSFPPPPPTIVVRLFAFFPTAVLALFKAQSYKALSAQEPNPTNKHLLNFKETQHMLTVKHLHSDWLDWGQSAQYAPRSIELTVWIGIYPSLAALLEHATAWGNSLSLKATMYVSLIDRAKSIYQVDTYIQNLPSACYREAYEKCKSALSKILPTSQSPLHAQPSVEVLTNT